MQQKRNLAARGSAAHGLTIFSGLLLAIVLVSAVLLIIATVLAAAAAAVGHPRALLGARGAAQRRGRGPPPPGSVARALLPAGALAACTHSHFCAQYCCTQCASKAHARTQSAFVDTSILQATCCTCKPVATLPEPDTHTCNDKSAHLPPCASLSSTSLKHIGTTSATSLALYTCASLFPA